MSALPELDLLGRRLEAALQREVPRRHRRRRAGVAGLVAAACIAVPAAGSVTDWAGLAGGQTALPTQVDSSLRVHLLGGTDELGSWRLEGYRAQLSGGGVGLCVFVTRDTGGTGRCLPEKELGALMTTGEDPGVRVAVGVVTGDVARVEVRLQRADGQTHVVQVHPRPAHVAELKRSALPTGLRPYAVPYGRDDSSVVSVRALGADGRLLAQDPPSSATEAP